MKKFLLFPAMLVLCGVLTGGGCTGMVSAQAVANTTAKVTYGYEDLIDGKVDVSKLTALEKRVYKRNASMLRQTVAKALKKDDLDVPKNLWGGKGPR